jgi:hypothetical protein
MSGILAARVAARLQADLGERVTLEEGHTAEFTVLVDGATVVTRGLWALLGVVPPYGRVSSAVRTALARAR